MTHFRLLILLASLLIASSAFAQNDTIVGKHVTDCVPAKVALLHDYMSSMADKSKTPDSRKYYREKALELFVMQGEPYETEGMRHPGVKIVTVSTQPKKRTMRLVKDYFKMLEHLRYPQINIQTIDIIELSDLKKIDNNIYVCTAYLATRFMGYHDGMPAYSDVTNRHLQIYISAEEEIDGHEFTVLFGDMTGTEAVSTL